MKVTGIIAEYNPFHRGHQYQIQYIKENFHSDYVVAVMSGDYVQRGTPALFSKYTRAEMALLCGADLVLELPVSVSSATAEQFASGSVSLLDSLQVVDQLCFGSEYGEISALNELADILVKEPEPYPCFLKKFLSEGLSFPAARSKAMTEYFHDPRTFSGDDFDGVLTPLLNQATAILDSPNSILGIEYCKALIRQKSKIKPVTIRRQGMGYHETNLNSSSGENNFASASAIRKLLSSEDSLSVREQISRQVPEEICPLLLNALSSGEYMTEAVLDDILVYRLMYEDSAGLSKYADISPALAMRITNCQNQISGFSQAASLLKTKELTLTRIQRALLHMILQIHDTPAHIPYARVLGFRRESSPLLKEIKRKSSIPLITKLADADTLLDEEGMRILSETTAASNLYEKMLCKKSGRKFVHEYQKQLIIL